MLLSHLYRIYRLYRHAQLKRELMLAPQAYASIDMPIISEDDARAHSANMSIVARGDEKPG
jgi:hypothetical protein